MTPKMQKQLIRDAVKAHSDLNIFAAIAAVLEGSVLSSDAQDDEIKINRLCQGAQQKCLRRYDRAMNALGHPYGRPAAEQTPEVK